MSSKIASKKITILHVIGSMNRGGSETFLMNVLRNIDKNKFQFIFLCYGSEPFDYEAEIISLGAKLVRIPDIKTIGVKKHIQELLRVIQENDIDGVHAHTYYNSVFSLSAAFIAGLRIRAVHSHNTVAEPNPSIYKKVYFLISKMGISLFANKFLACGEDAGRALFRRTARFTVVHNGIDIENFIYDDNIRDEVRRELNLGSNTTAIMHVGRFDKQKNHTFLIEVFDRLVVSNPDSVLILVGDGSLRQSIEEKVTSLGIMDKVKFLGKRSDAYKLYSAADILVMPSLYEGLPVVLVEAQVNGLSSLVSDSVPTAAKLTRDVEFYPLSKGADAWASKLKSIDTSRSDNREFFNNSTYDMKKGVKNIETLYENVAGNQQ